MPSNTSASTPMAPRPGERAPGPLCQPQGGWESGWEGRKGQAGLRVTGLAGRASQSHSANEEAEAQRGK